MAVHNRDQTEIDDAIDDLLGAYDQFARHSLEPGTRYCFDEIASAYPPTQRDQLAAEGLAAALLDLEVATVLERAAEETGEMQHDAGPGSLAAAVQSMSETIAALDDSAKMGGTRFSFDEAVRIPPDAVASPDLAGAKSGFQNHAQTAYDLLIEETFGVVASSASALSGIDANKIVESLGAVTSPLRISGVGRIAIRVLESVKRTIERLREFLGSENLKWIQTKLGEHIDALRQGEGAARRVLIHLYGCETGLHDVERWLVSTTADKDTIDRGTVDLAHLRDGASQTFAIFKRISRLIAVLTGPIKFILQKVGGSLPVDLIVWGAHLLIVGVALFRGMNYADATPLIEGTGGIISIAKRTLGIAG